MSVAKHWALVESVVVCAKYSKTPEIIDILHMQTRLNYGFFRGFWWFPSFFAAHKLGISQFGAQALPYPSDVVAMAQ